VGGMNWFPNRDAVHWFQQEVMPRLLRLEPGAQLNVLGKNDEGLSFPLERRIAMHGFVDDTRPYLERAAAVAVPIRVGGGTRLKVLEAMSMGKAMVSTRVGVEGIEVQDREHVLIADTAEEFAAALHELLGNPGLRRELGRAARRLVCERYRWDAIGRSLLEAYDQVVAK
jgi:glycosyltransferase involved in cell wall biosynthesis